MTDAVLGDAARTGPTAVRAWAPADGTGGGYRPLRTEPCTYDEAAVEPLDYAVHRAGRLRLGLVLPLVNDWPGYGGMRRPADGEGGGPAALADRGAACQCRVRDFPV